MEKIIDEIEKWAEENNYTIVTNDMWDIAQDTIHRYQKIEQILDDFDLEAWEVLEKVKEVVKDGNDD